MARRGVLGFALLLAASWSGASRADEAPITITVQGEARPETELASEPFAATSRVRRERLSEPALRASEVLRSEAGVQIAEAGALGAPATASIRGATSAQTPVYLAGVRLNDQVGGVADLSTLPLWLIDHVDVYRGNAPFEADELGIGGALFFEPRRPRRTEAAAGATLGSFGTRAGFGYVAVADERVALLTGLSLERADNDYPFRDDRGTLLQTSDDTRRRRSNSDSSVQDAWLLARARPSERSRLELLANTTAREQGAPKLALVPSRHARAELSRSLLALTARLALDASGRDVLSLETSSVDARSRLDDPQRELGALSDETVVRGRRVAQRAALQLALSRRLAWALSAGGSFESLQRLDAERESRASAHALRGATKLTWEPLQRLSLFGLLSAQCRSTRPGAAGCAELEPTGRAGAGYRGAGWTVFANLNRYQREPALGELYGAGVLVRGNAQLRPELGVSADAGARGEWRSGRVSLYGSAAGYVRTARDLVTYVRTAQGYVVPLNVASARVSGLELTAGADAFEHFRASCSLTLLDPRDTTDGRRLQNDVLPFMSRLALAPRVLVTTGERAGRGLRRADLGLELTYLSNRFADAAGLVVVPEQASLGVTGSLSWLSGALTTRARLANALDSERFDIVGYPLPGRSLYVSAEVLAP